MKFVTLIFGALGFLLVAGPAWSAGRPADLILRDAAFGCLIVAWCGRWFWRRCEAVFANVLAERRAAARAAAEIAAAAAAPAPAPTAGRRSSTPLN